MPPPPSTDLRPATTRRSLFSHLRTSLVALLLPFVPQGSAAAPDTALSVISTYECASVYWKSDDLGRCRVEYRPSGTGEWRDALDLIYIPMDRVDAGERLPGFNDRFTGQAPDLGAFETAAPPLQFGRRAYLRYDEGWAPWERY